MDKPRILPDRCVRRLSRAVGCRICEQCCPEGAILLCERPFDLSVNEDCNGCGLCWTKCPSEAILMPPEERNAFRPEELGVVCRKADPGWKEKPEGAVLRVPCVKEIGFRFLGARWLAGLRRLVIHGADCAECDAAFSPEGRDGVRRVNEILGAAGQASITVVPDASLGQLEDKAGRNSTADGRARATSRRRFLKTMITESLDAAFPSARGDADTSDGTSAFVAFLSALDGMLNRNKEEREGRLAAYRLSVSARLCYACKVCATFCPTGALHWEEDAAVSDSARLRIDPSRCSGCGVCIDLCDAGAVSCAFEPELRVEQLILFREERCRICDRRFTTSRTGEGLCPGCRRYGRHISPDAACVVD